MCSAPYRVGVQEYGCGQCAPCRLNRRRLWTARLQCEARFFSSNSFVTLTYDNENVPSDGSLVPAHMRDFLKRLRRRIEPLKVRYYGVGEYGDRTERPHYHLVLFGLDAARVVESAWGLGRTHSGEVNEASCAYVAKYVQKAMTAKEDHRLRGRHPEFARMSLKPGIGRGIVDYIADFLFTEQGVLNVIERGDVPESVRIGGKAYPLGRYLRRCLRDAAGFNDVGQPARAAFVRAIELQMELSEEGAINLRDDQRKVDYRRATFFAKLKPKERV